MFLIYELTNEINALEIPYSITLISYENYNVAINKYDEEHSIKEVQRIFDCIFINRFYTSLANSMKYVVNNLQFQSQEDRAFRAFFVFKWIG